MKIMYGILEQKDRQGTRYDKMAPKRAEPSQTAETHAWCHRGWAEFHRSGSYDSCSNFFVLCSSSLKALLLNENGKKEDIPESTVEDIKGLCEGSHF
jgi:hypothetical protein